MVEVRMHVRRAAVRMRCSQELARFDEHLVRVHIVQ